ncbi:4-hydroxythreonine-4-phosphate dehydrogenase PdxA [Rhodococcus sp. NPDC057297]|uniref:4-hydroxythreonine-4-phosphate dehydrogenase PdxA n=1 Tax=Rhodococcus sp. NPDC057297 TaxID=3346090 RepID=UPI003625FF1F
MGIDSLVILADDLSGAAESAAGFLASDVSLGLGVPSPNEVTSRITVVDLHTRKLDRADAARAVEDSLACFPGARVVKKIDSLLRGNIEAEVGALAADGSAVVVVAAFPAIGRTVVDGVVHVQDVPLHRTALWHAERDSPPTSVAAALGNISPTGVSLEQVRGAGLADVLSDLVALGRVPVCDAETDADIDAVVAASQSITGVRLVGTAALMASVARATSVSAHTHPTADHDFAGRSVLVVVGTADLVAVEQVRALENAGVPHVHLDARALVAGTIDVEPIFDALDSGTAIVTVSGPVTPADSAAVVAGLAQLVAWVERDRKSDLVLTGGETARTVLDRLGVRRLTPVCEIETGAVLSLTPAGRRVITRPGSFGGVDSLRVLADSLRSSSTDSKESFMSESTPLPLVAVTMGDGAGVGPEVIVPALLDAKTISWCRPVVIGDAKRLLSAAEVLGLDVDIAVVETIADAEFTPGRINVIDLDLLPDDLAWGELSAIAGDAAYQYIRVASELAVRGEVQAICTAPLNKEALHAAGHIYPGHTELLAHLTGTEEVSMMLSTPKLKVIHVTTHIGLLDAVAKIEPGLVERTIRRGYEALVRTGNASPKIGVCGINPHAGENGLFGYGEEDLKIVPAVEKLKVDGIDAVGPLPADTAFFLAGRGDYDLIVAMYHDQGHGPVKVLGIEAGVNITVGLPVIRTSVDHGTAFDIAGKGIAEAGSMVEALRQAAELATSTTVLK